MPEQSPDPERDLSRALDEIYALRALLACEARIAEVHGEYRTFPKSRRAILDESVERMREGARGLAAQALRDERYRHWRHELRSSTGSETMTWSQWRHGAA